MLVRLGIKATPHSNLDPDTAQIIAEELGFFVKRSYEKDLEAEIWNQAPVLLKKRPPIVTVMGHVNHGKTSLLDALKKTDVAHKEAGGITQHIGSYQVHLDKDKIITFIDTPGHEAFAKMRIRGAQITDLVILVVAADEGVNAQTIEAITHAKSANVPIIVAINKIDKANARPDHVRQELLMHGIVVEKLGGDVQDVEISALRGTQLDSLEEAILLQAEVLELNADDHMRAKGVLLETSLKKGHGIMTTLLIQEGCLSTGDVFVAGHTWGRVRLIVNDKGQIVKKAGPSQPVQIVGFTSAPQAGDRFVVVPDEACAKNIVQWKQKQLIKDESSPELMSLALHLKNQGIQELHLVMKADTQGSLEALLHEFSKIQHDEVAIHVVYKGVGAINESDALLAQTTGALLLAFHVDVAPEARKIIEQRALRVISHRVIYHIVEEVQKALSGLLIPIYQEEELGYAQVIQIFPVKKMLPVAGCIVKEGFLRRGELVRVTRHGNICHEGLIKSIRHVKDDVKEINTGYECGVIVEGYRDVLLGDILRCFAKKEIQRSIG